MAQTVKHPRQATENLFAHTSDRVEGLTERGPKHSPHATTPPATQLAQRPTATQPTATAPASFTPTPTPTPAPALTRPLTPAPANVELLPAPPVSPTSATAAAPVATASEPTNASPADAAPAKTTWCRVRIRNIGAQPATQVAVTVSSPENAPLVSKEGQTASRPAIGQMEFAPVPQVGANEEVILHVGVATADERANRLRVQVRDAQGGTNQDVQARWKVAIEAAE